MVLFNNSILLTWGHSNHTGSGIINLPISYTDSFVVMASINKWVANAPYSITVAPNSLSQIKLDHWYNNGQSLADPTSFLTIGF